MCATLSLQFSNPPPSHSRRLTQICEYKGVVIHEYTYVHTRAHIKHLTQTEAFGDRTPG